MRLRKLMNAINCLSWFRTLTRFRTSGLRCSQLMLMIRYSLGILAANWRHPKPFNVQEATQLISQLKGDVAPEEAYQVGSSLEDIGIYARAVGDLSIAASRSHGFPETAASVYRAWAKSSITT